MRVSSHSCPGARSRGLLLCQTRSPSVSPPLRCACSYLGYEDLVAVPSGGPEGGDGSNKPDMFEGQEEVRPPEPSLDLLPCLTRRRRVQERKAWWPRLRDYMGKDIMSLMSVPVFIMARLRRCLLVALC